MNENTHVVYVIKGENKSVRKLFDKLAAFIPNSGHHRCGDFTIFFIDWKKMAEILKKEMKIRRFLGNASHRIIASFEYRGGRIFNVVHSKGWYTTKYGDVDFSINDTFEHYPLILNHILGEAGKGYHIEPVTEPFALGTFTCEACEKTQPSIELPHGIFSTLISTFSDTPPPGGYVDLIQKKCKLCGKNICFNHALKIATNKKDMNSSQLYFSDKENELACYDCVFKHFKKYGSKKIEFRREGAFSCILVKGKDKKPYYYYVDWPKQEYLKDLFRKMGGKVASIEEIWEKKKVEYLRMSHAPLEINYVCPLCKYEFTYQTVLEPKQKALELSCPSCHHISKKKITNKMLITHRN